MAISFVGDAPYDTRVGAGNISPSMPTGWQEKFLNLCFTGVYSGSRTIANPSGFQRLSADVNAKQAPVFGRIAVAGDVAPILDWGATQFITMATFDLGTLVAQDITVMGAGSDKVANSTTQVLYPGITPPVDNCLVVWGGRRFKDTSSSDGGTFSANPTGFIKIRESVPTGTFRPAAVWGYAIQGTAAAIAAQASTLDKSDTSDNAQGWIIALHVSGDGHLISTDLSGGFQTLSGGLR